MNDQADRLIRNVRAMLRVIDGLEILKEDSGSWRETLLINFTLALYRHRLDQARNVMPARILAELEKK